MKTLDKLKPKSTAKIVKVHGRSPIKRRFMDMGIVNGTPIEVVKVAPLGDPIQISVLGYELTLRKADAKNIEVE